MESSNSDEPRHISESLEEAAEMLASPREPMSEEARDQLDSHQTVQDLVHELDEINSRLESGDATPEDMRRRDDIRIEIIAERRGSGGIEPTE